MNGKQQRTARVSGIDESKRSVTLIVSSKAALPTPVMRDGQEKVVPLAIVSWNLERFVGTPDRDGNNVILWAHEGNRLPIGTGHDVEETEDGLRMRVQFGSKNANPFAEQAYQALREGLIKAFSVGFGEGEDEEQLDGSIVRKRAVLQEVSLVPVPLDADAIVPVTETEEQRKRRLASAGGRAMAALRGTPRLDADACVRLDSGRLGKLERTQVGGFRVPARLTRVGVFTYVFPDGRKRREYRPASEVFAPESLATLRAAPVTHGFEGHRALVTPETFRDFTRGHVEDVRADGKYVAGTLLINDAETIEGIERADLRDTSCGYTCKFEMTPGVFEGEQYDCVQRTIRYNHVAVLPPGGGRAGADVGLRLDAHDAVCVEEEEKEMSVKIIRLDGKDFEFGSELHIAHIETSHSTAIARLDGEHKLALKAANDRAEELQAKFDAGEVARKKREKDIEDEKAKAEAESAQRTKRKLRLLKRFADFMDEDEDDAEEKMDGLLALSERELMVKTIQHHEGYEKFDGLDEGGKPHEDSYVTATYNVLTKKPTVRADGIDSVVTKLRDAQRLDGAADDIEAEARKRNRERAQEAWKRPDQRAAK